MSTQQAWRPAPRRNALHSAAPLDPYPDV